MKMYEVGGCVRDEILGTPSKDIDYSVVLDDGDVFKMDKAFYGVPTPFDYMVGELEAMGVKIIRDKNDIPVGAEYLTARGIAPKDFPNHPGRALDFVLARKDGEYTDGRRPDSVSIGTLYDDLARRDFSMNAIAKADDGTYIDPYDGIKAIEERVIYCVGNPRDRFAEDALRVIRALRFSVTKGFHIAEGVAFCMQLQSVLDDIVNNISDDRIKAELSKMFHFDTVASLNALSKFPRLTEAMFAGNVSLDATLKTKGRGK